MPFAAATGSEFPDFPTGGEKVLRGPQKVTVTLS